MQTWGPINSLSILFYWNLSINAWIGVPQTIMIILSAHEQTDVTESREMHCCIAFNRLDIRSMIVILKLFVAQMREKMCR